MSNAVWYHYPVGLIRVIVVSFISTTLLILGGGFAPQATEAADPGLPFIEDFASTSLRDPAGTTADWSTEEQELLLAWRQTVYGPFAGVAGSDLSWIILNTLCLAVGDMDGDGDLDVVIGNDGLNWLCLNDGDGTTWTCSYISSDAAVTQGVAVADLNGDGALEVVCGSWDGRMYVWDHAGRPLPGWPQSAADQFTSSAALVDLDGDGAPDIVAGSKDGNLYGWDHRGQPLPGFPIYLGHHVLSSPWVGDLEGNGRADIVVGASNGIHLLRDVGSLGIAPWPRFHRDAQNTGYVP